MNTQSKKPYFRKMTYSEELDYMGCEERPIIAEFKDFMFDGYLVDIDIVIDTWTNLEDVQIERLGFHIYAKDTKNRSYVCMSELTTRTRTQMQQIAREVMGVNYLSIVTFQANKFSIFEQ